MIHHQRILVTGSEGQLGSELRRLLGERAVGLDLPDLDITDSDAVRAAFDRHCPDVVVNTAAFTHVDGAEAEPERCCAVNVRGVENLVDVCKASGTPIVQISTDYVFDGRQTRPYSESDEPNPQSTYGRTKREAEQIVARYPHHLILRTAGLFGVGGSSAARNFVDTMLKLAGQRRPLRVVGDQITSLTDARDLALAIVALLETGSRGLFHVTNSGSASWHQFAVEAFRIAGLSPEIEAIPMADYRCEAKRPRFSVLNSDKYRATPGCFPMPRWQDALSAYLARRQG